MTYVPAADRYEQSSYRRCGRSGLHLPAVSLGLWHNFGDDRHSRTSARSCAGRSTWASPISTWPTTTARRRGPRSATSAVIRTTDLALYRDELIISTGGLRHVARAVRRVGLAQVPAGLARPEPRAHGARLRRHLLLAPLDPDTPLEETLGALDTAVRQGKALYAGVSSYRPSVQAKPRRPCATWARRCSSTSPRTRCSTAGSSPTCSRCSAKRASAASLLPDRPGDADRQATWTACRRTRAPPGQLPQARLPDRREPARVRALNEIAADRGQALVQMAIA